MGRRARHAHGRRARRSRPAARTGGTEESAQGMTGLTYDAGALIAAERNVRRMWALHRRVLERGAVPTMPAAVLAEGWRAGTQTARLLKGCAIEPLGAASARAAGELLASGASRRIAVTTYRRTGGTAGRPSGGWRWRPRHAGAVDDVVDLRADRPRASRFASATGGSYGASRTGTAR